jgi:hypothetical protein
VQAARPPEQVAWRPPPPKPRIRSAEGVWGGWGGCNLPQKVHGAPALGSLTSNVVIGRIRFVPRHHIRRRSSVWCNDRRGNHLRAFKALGWPGSCTASQWSLKTATFWVTPQNLCLSSSWMQWACAEHVLAAKAATSTDDSTDEQSDPRSRVSGSMASPSHHGVSSLHSRLTSNARCNIWAVRVQRTAVT